MKAAEKEHSVVTETYIQAINEKDHELSTQNTLLEAYRGTDQATRLHLNRNLDEIFKIKTRRKSGSTNQVNVNTCENEECTTIDTDLVRCSICSKYVCEVCNEVPIAKLKSVIKICRRVYFICKTCTNTCEDKVAKNETDVGITENHNKETLTNKNLLRDDLNSKIEVIKSMELVHTSLKRLIGDKDETIANLKIIINGLQNENCYSETVKIDLIEARKIIALKDAEISKHQEESQQMKSAETDDDQIIILNAQIESLKEANTALYS